MPEISPTALPSTWSSTWVDNPLITNLVPPSQLVSYDYNHENESERESGVDDESEILV